MIIFVFIKDPEIDPEIVGQQLHKMRLSTEKQRKSLKILKKREWNG